MNATLRIGAVIVIIILLLAGADAWFKERPHRLALEQQNVQTTAPEPTEDAETPLPVQPSSAMSSSASERPVVKKGISKKGGIDVRAVLASLQLIAQPTNEASLLSLAAPNLRVQTAVLIQNNDRAALFAWIESDDVKTVFSSLKTALQEQFSPKLSSLVDETRTSENNAPVDILSFNDPAISTEDVLFLRIRTRLYELHIVEKSKDAIGELIMALSK